MKNFSGEKKSFFLTRPTCSLGEIAPQALWRSRGAPKTSNQLLWVYYTVIRLIGPSWGHLGAHRGPKVPIAHWEANFRLTGRNCPTSPVELWRGPKDLKPVYYTVICLIGPSWGHLGAHRGPKGPFLGPKWGWFSPPLNIGMWGVQTGAMKIPAPTARFQIIYFLVPWGPLTVTLLCSSIIWS